MKKIRLLKLELTNYRNIEHEVYVFDGSNAKIVGENRIGKTNTLEAIYFLLSNYLLDGSSDLTAIKPLSDTKKEVCVEGTFKVDDMEIAIKKIYGEKWVKTRGTETLSMQGHYEKYFVNGIEQSKEKDYQDLLEEYFGVRNDMKGEVDKVQMLSNPLYLGNLGDGETKSWQMLRTFIVKLIGDVNDEEVFAKEPSTMVIKEDLLHALGKTDQLKKMYNNDIDTLNNQIVGYDSNIELLEKTSNPTDQEVEFAKSQIEEIDNQIANAKTSSSEDSVVKQYEQELVELGNQINDKSQEEYNAFISNCANSEESKNKAKIDELHSKVNSYVNYLTDVQIKKGKLESDLNAKKSSRENLVIAYKKYDSEIKNVDNSIVKECPTCHRPFSDDELATRKEEIVKDLIASKDKITADGKALKEEIDKLTEEISTYEKDETYTKGEIAKFREEIAKLDSVSYEKPTYKESEELVALKEKRQKLNEQLIARKQKVSENATNNFDLITELEQKKQGYIEVVEARNYYKKQMTLLESVKLSKKQVSDELISKEQKKEALSTFIYAKLRLLDEHIAKVFGKLRFQLIKENINGGFDPVCKPYIYDVEKDESTDVLWKSGSKSEKIITGVAIAEAIRNALNLSQLPFLFDEGGEISTETFKNKFKTEAQIICVRVEDNIMKPIVAKF